MPSVSDNEHSVAGPALMMDNDKVQPSHPIMQKLWEHPASGFRPVASQVLTLLCFAPEVVDQVLGLHGRLPVLWPTYTGVAG